MKINDDCFFGKDLSHEQNILEKVKENIEQEILDSEISYSLRERSLTICFENKMMNEKIANVLLFKVDWLMDEHFFKKNGLRELGWCSRYLLDRRSLQYHKDQQELKN